MFQNLLGNSLVQNISSNPAIPSNAPPMDMVKNVDPSNLYTLISCQFIVLRYREITYVV